MKAAAIQSLIDNPAQFRETLKLDELEAMIKKMFPAVPLELKFGLADHRSVGDAKMFFTVDSNDIVDYCGVFSQAMTEVRMGEFGSDLSWSAEDGYRVWFRLHLNYRHIGSGSNGTQLATFTFQDGTWSKSEFKGSER